MESIFTLGRLIIGEYEEVLLPQRNGRKKLSPEVDLFNLFEYLRSDRAFRMLALEFLEEEIQVRCGGKIDWIVFPTTPYGINFFRELARRLGIEKVYSRPMKDEWEIPVETGERILQVSSMVREHDCLTAVRGKIRRSVRGKIHASQFVPMVVTILTSNRVFEFEGSPVISVNKIESLKYWTDCRCRYCGSHIKSNRGNRAAN